MNSLASLAGRYSEKDEETQAKLRKSHSES
jgi:hypothetical protein